MTVKPAKADQLPREYYRETIGSYNSSHFKNFFKAVLAMSPHDNLVHREFEKQSFMLGFFFKNREDADLAYDILLYVFDKHFPEDEAVSAGVFLNKYMRSLYESGFFG
jgi:hypothetical protein